MPKPNERLRAALLQAGKTPSDLSEALNVDPKTVERWIGGRIPYRRTRYRVSAYLKMDEEDLWPDALTRDQVATASESEILEIHPHRWAVPRDAWGHLFDSAEQEIGILVYSGFFIADDAGLLSLLTAKADDGVRVRILLGDPDSSEIAARGAMEGIDEALASKIRNAIVLYRPLLEADGIEIRLHDTVLYNSIYRADDELMVNSHVYGLPASQAPVLRLRQVMGGGMVKAYLKSFDLVWSQARPLD